MPRRISLLLSLIVGLCTLTFVLLWYTKSTDTTDTKHTIVLMGDSILDNFYWIKPEVDGSKKDLTWQLNDQNGKYKAYNYAVDEKVTEDLLAGKIPSKRYEQARKKAGMSAYPKEKNGKMCPLKLLERHHSKTKNLTILLSVGGNDVRNALLNRIHENQALLTPPHILEDIRSNLNETIGRIKKINNHAKVVLIEPYVPHIYCLLQLYPILKDHIIRLRDCLGEVISEVAEKHNCHVINLALTFNPYDEKDYGYDPTTDYRRTTPIEPSRRSIGYMVELITYLTEDSDTATTSYIYYGKERFVFKKKNSSTGRAEAAKALHRYLWDCKAGDNPRAIVPTMRCLRLRRK